MEPADTNTPEDASGNEEEVKTARRRRLRRVFVRFAQTTSFQGIPFVYSSKHLYSKVAWAVFFAVALGIAIFHCFTIFEQYYKFEVTAQVNIGYETLHFPSITICNLNPIRQSRTTLAQPELQHFLSTLRMQESYARPITSKPDLQEILDTEKRLDTSNRKKRQSGGSACWSSPCAFGVCVNVNEGKAFVCRCQSGYTGVRCQEQVTKCSSNPCQNGATCRPTGADAGYVCECTAGYTSVHCEEDVDECSGAANPCQDPLVCYNNPGSYDCIRYDFCLNQPCQDGATCVGNEEGYKCICPQGFVQSSDGRHCSIVINYNPYQSLLNMSSDFLTYYPEEDDQQLEDYGSGELAVKFVVEEEMKELLGKEEEQTRLAMGHQKEVMILNCVFNGKVCSTAEFQNILSPAYGNCFSYNHPKIRQSSYKSKRSGSQYGLNMLLYLEGHEYVAGLSPGRGARVDIHPFKTMPFVEENGISVAPGTTTYVGLRMQNFTRLGNEYGYCDKGVDFEEYYNATYTVDGCVNTCLDRIIERECQCYRSEYLAYYSEESKRKLSACRKKEQKLCVYEKRAAFETGTIGCSCEQACRSSTFDVEISSNDWPDKAYWYSLVNLACQQDEYGCWQLQQYLTEKERHEALRANFLELKIFYRDLNYETIFEVPSYEIGQFLSDFGGTLGLWVGASVMTLVEFLDFLISLCLYCVTKPVVDSRHNKKLRAAEANRSRSTTDSWLGPHRYQASQVSGDLHMGAAPQNSRGHKHGTQFPDFSHR